MRRASEAFCEAVRANWDNAREVVNKGLDEVFRIPGVELDHDDQVSLAADVGLLVGRFANGNPAEFIAAFERDILSNY